MSDHLINGPADAGRTLILAHGAGAPMDSAFMDIIARGLAEQGFRVVRFEFPYMARRRTEGVKPPPNGQGILLDHWRQVYARYAGDGDVFIGGKSMGGRMASMLADELGAKGLICLGYPFHPPGKPEKRRTSHLESLGTPMLILQGERDTFGTKEEVSGYTLSKSIVFDWLPDGDHSFKPRKKSGYTEQENLEKAVSVIAAWMHQH